MFLFHADSKSIKADVDRFFNFKYNLQNPRETKIHPISGQNKIILIRTICGKNKKQKKSAITSLPRSIRGQLYRKTKKPFAVTNGFIYHLLFYVLPDYYS